MNPKKCKKALSVNSKFYTDKEIVNLFQELKTSSNEVKIQFYANQIDTVESLFEQRKINIEDFLVGLGFGQTSYCSPLIRIPDRFFVEPSYARGVCVTNLIQRRNASLLRESCSQNVNLHLPEPFAMSKQICDKTHSLCARKIQTQMSVSNKPVILLIGPQRYQCLDASIIPCETGNNMEYNPFDKAFHFAFKSVNRPKELPMNKPIRRLSCPNITLELSKIYNVNHKEREMCDISEKYRYESGANIITEVSKKEGTIPNKPESADESSLQEEQTYKSCEKSFMYEEMNSMLKETVKYASDIHIILTLECVIMSLNFLQYILLMSSTESTISSDDDLFTRKSCKAKALQFPKLFAEIKELDLINKSIKDFQQKEHSYPVLNYVNQKISSIYSMVKKINDQSTEPRENERIL